MDTKTTMQLQRVEKGGKPAIRLVVRNASAELRVLLDTLGILPVCDIANCREIICSTPAELDAARNPLLARVVGKADPNGIIELR
jgi:hypothetical protein